VDGLIGKARLFIRLWFNPTLSWLFVCLAIQKQRHPVTKCAQILMSTLLRSSVIAAVALLAWCFWCAGIVWFNGGEGLNWLHGFHWGAIPVCAVIALGCAAAVARQNDPVRLLLFIVLAWAICFTAFAAGRAELYQIFGGSYFVGVTPLIMLALYGIAVSISLPWFASRLLTPLHWWTALYSAAALLLAMIFASLTVIYFPGGRHSDLFNAIRLGYPAFWTALLLPIALWAGVKRQKSARKISNLAVICNELRSAVPERAAKPPDSQ
jgi:hypothetical protein